MMQLSRFGLVGMAALVVHWLVVVILVPLALVPLVANMFAFLVAFQVSYFGHRRWTFAATHLPMQQTLPRFLLVALASFALNEVCYALLLYYTSLDYRVSLLLVLALVASLTFVTSKKWAFQ
jgi:putative flippase GtrA